MKIARFLAVSVLILPAAAAASAQEGVATFTYTHVAQAASPQGQVRLYYSPNAMRSEVQMEMNASGERTRPRPAGAPSTYKMTMIQKLAEPDKIYTVDDEHKTYTVMDLAKIRQSTKAPEHTYTVKRLGTDRVAGISCEKALMTSSNGSEVEVCVASEIVAASGWWSAMNRQRPGQGNWMKAMFDAGLKGFPIRMKVRSAQKDGEVDMELVSLEKKSVPAAMFQIPAGYRETSTPGMSPDQEKQMKDALSRMTPEQRKAYEDAMKSRR
jgi:hypothetical protein